MQRSKLPLCVTIAAIIMTNAAFADPADDMAQKAALKFGGKVQQRFAETETGLVGFVLESNTGDSLVAYVDPQGKFLTTGVLLDKNGMNRTYEDHKRFVTEDDTPALLQKANAVIEGKKGAKKIMWVFAEPNCGWCRKEHFALQDVKEVEIRWVMFGFNDDGNIKVGKILASHDPVRSLTANYAAGDPGGDAPDAQTIERVKTNNAIARKLKVNGTPTIIYTGKSGKLVTLPGAILNDRIEQTIGDIAG